MVAVVAAGTLIAGIVGFAVFGAALALRYALRHRQRMCEAVTVGLSAGGSSWRVRCYRGIPGGRSTATPAIHRVCSCWR
ncbi:hypothetical protein I552_7799 [Mycobacterium xenopi 3993]|nr:hypothetical protein I552_7799 [Mycobacterium xenopi 3993]